MSLGNFGQLRASIADHATRTDLTAQIYDFVGWAHQEICRKLRAPLLYKRAQVALDAETITAPSDFLAARRFYIDTTPRRILQLKDSAELVELTANLISADYPSYFAVEGTDTIAFAPLYGGSVTGELLYYAEPSPLVDDANTNVVLTKYPFLYLYGALEALFRYLEDDNNADRYGQLFGALLLSINAEEAKDALRGPLAGSPNGGVV